MAKKTGLPEGNAHHALDAFLEVVQETLAKGEDVRILGFGTFEVRNYLPRTGRNPTTGEAMQLPGGRRPKFVVGAALKKAVEEKKASA